MEPISTFGLVSLELVCTFIIISIVILIIGKIFGFTITEHGITYIGPNCYNLNFTIKQIGENNYSVVVRTIDSIFFINSIKYNIGDFSDGRYYYKDLHSAKLDCKSVLEHVRAQYLKTHFLTDNTVVNKSNIIVTRKGEIVERITGI